MLLKISGKKQLDCSGVLIAPRLVLTAGHCLYGARKVTARIGSEEIAAENWLVNPSWSAGLPARDWDSRIDASNGDTYVDLAVLLLQRESKNARPIKLTQEPSLSDGDALTTYGYARGKMLEPLYAIDMSNASFVRRLSAHGPFKFYASGGSAWCQGDSGGPVTRYEDGSEKLVGIVGLGLGAIDHDPSSAIALRWGGAARVPKCGAYAYVQDVRLHSDWIARATASLTDDTPITSSLTASRSTASEDARERMRDIR